MANDPTHQFLVNKIVPIEIGGIDFSFTNASLFMVAAVIVGALLGYLLDHFAGTGPWGMIVLLLLGFSAGVLNVMRAAGMVASPHPVDRLAGREPGKAGSGRDETETKDGA